MGWIFKNTCVQCMDEHTCTCTHTTCNHISLYTLLIINLFIIFYLFIFSAGGPSISKARGNITLMMLVSGRGDTGRYHATSTEEDRVLWVHWSTG